jgi:TonB family protein
MRCVFALIPFFVLAWLPAAGQQNAQTVGAAGAGVVAPVLLPTTVAVSTPKHCEEFDGVAKFAATIDAAGLLHELKVLEVSDRRLAAFATEITEAQRFTPATVNGSPKAVAVELTVGLHTCAQHEKHSVDGNFYQFTLRAHPLIALAVAESPAAQEVVSPAPTQVTTVEQVGEHISAPIPTVVKDPEIPVSRKFLKRGFCLLGVTIDANGVPQNVHVFRGLEPELDSNATEAAKSWRFKPALRDGSVPVAVEGTFAATFVYVEKEPVAFALFIPKTPEKVIAANAHHDKNQSDLEPINADEVTARYRPRSRVAGLSLVSMVVDTNGVPQNVHIVKGLDSSLDMETVAMVEHLRFKPVIKDGTTPVSVGVIVPVHYRVNTWKNVIFAIANISILLFA